MNPQFKLVYLAVLALSGVLLLLSFLSAVWLFDDPTTAAQEKLFTVMTHAFTLCVGFLAGGYKSSTQ